MPLVFLNYFCGDVNTLKNDFTVSNGNRVVLLLYSCWTIMSLIKEKVVPMKAADGAFCYYAE